jgi:gamma-glutamyltranspeptidase/glutathione hydrolase
MTSRKKTLITASTLILALILTGVFLMINAQNKTEKPPLHGKHWMAITGKPLAATAGAMMRGGVVS